MDQWHRGQIEAPRGANETAADWQQNLFDELVTRDPYSAFGQGALQEVLWDLRADLGARYARPGLPVLDIGSGNGLVARRVADLTGCTVVGIDVSGECVSYATAHNAHPHVSYHKMAIEDFVPDEPLGLVTMYEVIEHVDDPRAVLRQVHDWLAPGGYVVLSTPNRSSLNRRIKALPGLRALYLRLSGHPADEVSAGHVEEYHFDEMVGFLRDAGFELAQSRGVVLLLPFPGAIRPLARSPRFARLNARSGDWAPSLAGAMYLVGRRAD